MESLVNAEWLVGQLGAPDLRVLECTVELAAGPDGFVAHPVPEQWAASHIPGSSYADLTNDLSDPDSDLRFTMPTADRFAAGMEALGVGGGTRVVLYDRRMTMWATRVFWMLKAFGFDECAVLDGGWKSWQLAGAPVSDQPAPAWPAASFEPQLRPTMIASLDEMSAAVGDDASCIINSLSPQNHDGSDDSYGRLGHIPGATNVFAAALIDRETQQYLPVSELRALFEHLRADQKVITYCGGGIAATSDAFVLTELLGHRDVAVYDGSLSEWTRDPKRPMVTTD